MSNIPEDDDLQAFLPLWLERYLEKTPEDERKEFLAKYFAAVREALQQVSTLPQIADGTQAGKLSARIPGTNRFLNLKEGAGAALKYGGPILLAAILAPPLLAALGIAVGAHITAGTALGAGLALKEAYASLGPIEMDTYIAVAAAIERNKNVTLGNSGASLHDVLKSFDLDKKLMPPNDPKAVLKQLLTKKVLTVDASAGLEQYYLAL